MGRSKRTIRQLPPYYHEFAKSWSDDHPTRSQRERADRATRRFFRIVVTLFVVLPASVFVAWHLMTVVPQTMNWMADEISTTPAATESGFIGGSGVSKPRTGIGQGSDETDIEYIARLRNEREAYETQQLINHLHLEAEIAREQEEQRWGYDD